MTTSRLSFSRTIFCRFFLDKRLRVDVERVLFLLGPVALLSGFSAFDFPPHSRRCLIFGLGFFLILSKLDWGL